MDPLVLVLAVGVGLSLGLLGGGGSILLVPLLVYVAGTEPQQAIVLSLFVVGATSVAGAVPHARAGRVDWRTAGLFGSASMGGAYLGGRLGSVLPGSVLLGAFAVVMVVTAAAMLRSSSEPVPAGTTTHALPKVLAEGLGVGLVTGLVGAGGGFLVVPALVLLGGLPMPTAVGTSLVVIAMKSVAGVAGYLSGVEVAWGDAAVVTGATVAGALLGARLVDRIPAERLRDAFGWVVLAMAGVVVAQEAPDAVVTHPATWAAAVAVALVLVLWLRRGSRPDATSATATTDAPTPDARATTTRTTSNRDPERNTTCADPSAASDAARPRGPDAATTSNR